MKSLFYTCATVLLALSFFSCGDSIATADLNQKETIANPQIILIKSIIIGTGDVSDSGRTVSSVEMIDSINPVAEKVYDAKSYSFTIEEKNIRLKKLLSQDPGELIPINKGIMIWKDNGRYCIRHK